MFPRKEYGEDKEKGEWKEETNTGWKQRIYKIPFKKKKTFPFRREISPCGGLPRSGGATYQIYLESATFRQAAKRARASRTFLNILSSGSPEKFPVRRERQSRVDVKAQSKDGGYIEKK